MTTDGIGDYYSFGIQAALYKHATAGGSYLVSNSLLSTATWLRSFGRAEPSAFARTLETLDDVRSRGGMEKMRGFGGGEVESVKYAAEFVGAEVGWKFAAEGMDADCAEWL